MKKKKISPKTKARTAPARARPTKARRSDRPTPTKKPMLWLLRLYVAGQTPNSLTAFSNLKQICDEHLSGNYRIEVIDLTKAPQRALDDQIIALPTLVRKLPEPIKRVIGDLSDIERVLVGMDVRRVSQSKPYKSAR